MPIHFLTIPFDLDAADIVCWSRQNIAIMSSILKNLPDWVEEYDREDRNMRCYDC